MSSDGKVPATAVPGTTLGLATQYHPGHGTHLYEGKVVASLLGHVTVTQPDKAPGAPAKRLTKITARAAEELPTISVARHQKRREVLPDVGSVVLCRVVRLVPKQAIVSIQQVGTTVLDTEWQGVIRSQDVRATEKDKVKIYESFKPGDTVRAQVVRCALLLLCFFSSLIDANLPSSGYPHMLSFWVSVFLFLFLRPAIVWATACLAILCLHCLRWLSLPRSVKPFSAQPRILPPRPPPIPLPRIPATNNDPVLDIVGRPSKLLPLYRIK